MFLRQRPTRTLEQRAVSLYPFVPGFNPHSIKSLAILSSLEETAQRKLSQLSWVTIYFYIFGWKRLIWLMHFGVCHASSHPTYPSSLPSLGLASPPPPALPYKLNRIHSTSAISCELTKIQPCKRQQQQDPEKWEAMPVLLLNASPLPASSSRHGAWSCDVISCLRQEVDKPFSESVVLLASLPPWGPDCLLRAKERELLHFLNATLVWMFLFVRVTSFDVECSFCGGGNIGENMLALYLYDPPIKS